MKWYCTCKDSSYALQTVMVDTSIQGIHTLIYLEFMRIYLSHKQPLFVPASKAILQHLPYMAVQRRFKRHISARKRAIPLKMDMLTNL